MKLSFFLFFVALINVQATTYSQRTKISIDLKEVSVEEVLKKIESLSEFNFLYNDNEIDFERIISVKAEKERISTILNVIFKESNIIYVVRDTQIILKQGADEKPVPVLNEKNEQPEIQEVEISGVVTDKDGTPLPGVNIVIEGTTIGTDTDFDGKYTIETVKGAVLTFIYIGMETQSVTVGDSKIIDVVLKEAANTLEEVVVTALGIKKEKKRIGYSIQEVKGVSLQKAKSPNVLESLTGKIAGLTIVNSSAEFFSDPAMYLRGRQPLLVVDGVPQSSSDLWNFSSDDIENVSVLKGTAAAALYGSLGRDGAVQITTKSGKNAIGTEISFNSTTTFQGGFLRIPEVQNQYGPGSIGQYQFGTGAAGSDGINDYDYTIWGPKFDGRLIKQFDSPIDPITGERTPTPWISRGEDNLKNFMEVGMVTSNNLSVSSASEKGSFIISNTYVYAKASTPGQRLDNNTFRLRGNLILSDAIDIDGSLQHNYQYSDNRIRGAYGPTSPIYNLAIWGGAHYDIRNFKNYWEPGKEGIRQNFVEHWRYNNPYAIAHAWKKPWTKNDITANLKVNFKINEDIKGYVRTNLNTYSLTDNEEISKDIYDYSISDRQGRFRYYSRNYFENNTDFLLMYNKKINEDFVLDLNLGANQRYLKDTRVSASTTQLVVPEIFTLQNSKDKVTPSSSSYSKGVYSAYASLDLSIKKYIFVGATGRIDKSSTLPSANDSFFYPSVYASFIVSDMFKLPEAISYLKLRASYAKVGGDMGIYQATSSYSTGKWRDLPTASFPGTIKNPNLDPSFSGSYEYGLELKLIKNRLGIDFAYYENELGPQIYTQPFSSASGYNGIQYNGRITETRGMEISLNAKIIQKDNFTWSALINFDKNKEYLVSLPPEKDGTPRDREGNIPVGGRLYDYWYYDFDESPSGELIINGDGLPKLTEDYVPLGNTQPDFTASIINTFAYKNFSLNILIDGRSGGITYDRYERDLWRAGSHPDAVHPEREISNLAYANGGDARTMLIEGVSVISGSATYDPKGNILTDDRVFGPNTTKIDYESWAKNYKAAWENNVIEKTFAKLREITLTYNLPSPILSKTFLNAASVSFVGRNLFYWTKDKDTFGDLDTYTVSTGDTNLQMPSQRSYGFNLNFKF